MTDMTIVAGLVGAGEFGATFLAQARRIAGLHVRLVCDRDPERARAALAAAGVPEDEIAACASRPAAVAAIEAGRVAIVEDVSLLAGLPLTVVLEAGLGDTLDANAPVVVPSVTVPDTFDLI